MAGRLSWIKKHKPLSMTVAALDDENAIEYMLHWDKDNLLEYLNTRCRAILAAAFSEGPGLPHPWDRSHWHGIAAAVGRTFSLYSQAESLHNNLPNESGDPWRFVVTYDGYSHFPLEYVFGDPAGKSVSPPNLEVKFPLRGTLSKGEQPEGSVALHVKSDRGRNTIYKQYRKFLEDELRFQLNLDSNSERMYPRQHFGCTFPVGNEVYWDVRIRFTDFLRRFLSAFRSPSFGEPDPFTVFFLVPTCSMGKNGPTTVPSGLFGYRYVIDDGQRRYIEEKNDQLLNRLDESERSMITNSSAGLFEIENGDVPFPYGVCSEVYLKASAVRPHKIHSVVDAYKYKGQNFAISEKAVLGDATLMEIPVYTVKDTLSSSFPDGPEVVLCVCLRNGHKQNLTFGDSGTYAARVFGGHLEPVVGSSFGPAEPGLIIETSQRVVSRYISSAPISGDMGIIGESEKIVELRSTIRQCSENDDPVMIRGESGTGKELVANAIHALSKRGLKPFIAVNCSELRGDYRMLQAELFGIVKGAFNEAVTKPGKIELAHGGTLFLDEIAEMPMDVQPTFFRFLQNGQFSRVGEHDNIRHADVRIVSATNRALRELADKGEFRKELLYRLLGNTIIIPSLRERGDDVVVLARLFLGRHDPSYSFTEEAENVLMDHEWKDNNVRELEDLIRDIYNNEKDKVQRFSEEHVLKWLKIYQYI